MATKLKQYFCAVVDCRKPFLSAYENARYCSYPCRYRGADQSPTQIVPCVECGSDIRTRRTDRKHCSEECRRTAQKNRPPHQRRHLHGTRTRRTALRCRDCRSVLAAHEKTYCDACVDSTRR